MKKIILSLIIITSFTACKKDNTRCYVCDYGAGYVNEGCYTQQDWDQHRATNHIVDSLTNIGKCFMTNRK